MICDLRASECLVGEPRAREGGLTSQITSMVVIRVCSDGQSYPPSLLSISCNYCSCETVKGCNVTVTSASRLPRALLTAEGSLQNLVYLHAIQRIVWLYAGWADGVEYVNEISDSRASSASSFPCVIL